MVCFRNMASLKILNNFRAISFIILVRENNLEFFQTSHIPRIIISAFSYNFNTFLGH